MKASRAGRGLALLVAAALAAGCSVFHWSGHHVQEDMGPGARVSQSELSPNYGLEKPEERSFEVRLSSSARRRLDDEIPRLSPEEAGKTLYYSDLGPRIIDVSAYPTQQKRNYETFMAVCSQCHTPARAINAPLVNRAFWRFYLYGMRMRSRVSAKTRTEISREETTAILDFLDYDARERKVKDARHFEDLTEELERRMEPVIAERLRRMREKRP